MVDKLKSLIPMGSDVAEGHQGGDAEVTLRDLIRNLGPRGDFLTATDFEEAVQNATIAVLYRSVTGNRASGGKHH